MSRALCAVVFCVFFFPSISGATDLWVDRGSLGGQCSDSRTRAQVTRANPWCHLAPAANSVQPGDVVHVREGTYTEIHRGQYPINNMLVWNMSVIQASFSGTASQPIVFIAEPGEEVIFSGSGGARWGILVAETQGFKPMYWEFYGFELTGFSQKAAMVQGTDNVVFGGLDVHDNIEGAIGIIRASNVRVENNSVHHNSLTGWTSPINFYRCGPGNVIRGNRVWANTDEDSRETEGHGIILDLCAEHGGEFLIENNVIWDNEGLCMNVFFTNNATIRNNTCYRNNLGRTDAQGDIGEIWLRGENNSVYNNILVAREPGAAIHIHWGDFDLSTTRTGNNILWSTHDDVAFWPPYPGVEGTLAEFQTATDWGDGSIQADPLLIDPENGDFQISCWSPAIDAANMLNAAPADILGVTRPIGASSDIGAYESACVLVPTPTPTPVPPTHTPTPTATPILPTPTPTPTMTPTQVLPSVRVRCPVCGEWMTIYLDAIEEIQ